MNRLKFSHFPLGRNVPYKKYNRPVIIILVKYSMKHHFKNQQSIIVIIRMNGTSKLMNIVLSNSSEEMVTMGKFFTRHRLLQKSATSRQIESATTRTTSYRHHYLKLKSHRSYPSNLSPAKRWMALHLSCADSRSTAHNAR
jgi:hypothetical protein